MASGCTTYALLIHFLLHILQAIKEEIYKKIDTETDEVVDVEKKLMLKGVYQRMYYVTIYIAYCLIIVSLAVIVLQIVVLDSLEIVFFICTKLLPAHCVVLEHTYTA